MLFPAFLIGHFFIRVSWYLFVVLICISQIITEAGNHFMSLLVIFIFSLEKYLFKLSTNILIRLYILLLLNCMFSLYILSGIWCANIFSQPKHYLLCFSWGNIFVLLTYKLFNDSFMWHRSFHKEMKTPIYLATFDELSMESHGQM